MYVYALRIQITKFKFYQYQLSVDSPNLMLPAIWHSEEITIYELYICRLSIIISTISNTCISSTVLVPWQIFILIPCTTKSTMTMVMSIFNLLIQKARSLGVKGTCTSTNLIGFIVGFIIGFCHNCHANRRVWGWYSVSNDMMTKTLKRIHAVD